MSVASGRVRVLYVVTLVAGLTLIGTEPAGAQQTAAGAEQEIRIGLVGIDSSHAGAFTQLLNDPSRPDHIPGARVVAAVTGGSPDVEASATRDVPVGEVQSTVRRGTP